MAALKIFKTNGKPALNSARGLYTDEKTGDTWISRDGNDVRWFSNVRHKEAPAKAEEPSDTINDEFVRTKQTDGEGLDAARKRLHQRLNELMNLVRIQAADEYEISEYKELTENLFRS